MKQHLSQGKKGAKRDMEDRDDEKEDWYKMDHKKRGRAIIFNNKKFKPRTLSAGKQYTPKERHGTDKDVKSLKETLKNVGFDPTMISVVESPSKATIDDALENLAGENHKDSDCIFVAVLSHGNKGEISAKDEDYPESDLWAPFLAEDKSKSLTGKPKIFVIQACRGYAADKGRAVLDEAKSGGGGALKKDVARSTASTIPVHADFLIARATPSGYPSMRKASGSYFIQALCDVLNKYGEKDDLVSILTKVNRRVAKKKMLVEDEERKQIPCYSSMLTKKIMLTKKE